MVILSVRYNAKNPLETYQGFLVTVKNDFASDRNPVELLFNSGSVRKDFVQAVNMAQNISATGEYLCDSSLDNFFAADAI